MIHNLGRAACLAVKGVAVGVVTGCSQGDPQVRMTVGQEDIWYQAEALEDTVLAFLGSGFSDGAFDSDSLGFRLSSDDDDDDDDDDGVGGGSTSTDAGSEGGDALDDIAYSRVASRQLSMELRNEMPVGGDVSVVAAVAGRIGYASYRLPDGVTIPDVGTELPDPISVRFQSAQLEPRLGLAWQAEEPFGTQLRLEGGGAYAVARVRTRIDSALIDTDSQTTTARPVAWFASEIQARPDANGVRPVLRAEARHMPDAATVASLSAGLQF